MEPRQMSNQSENMVAGVSKVNMIRHVRGMLMSPQLLMSPVTRGMRHVMTVMSTPVSRKPGSRDTSQPSPHTSHLQQPSPLLRLYQFYGENTKIKWWRKRGLKLVCSWEGVRCRNEMNEEDCFMLRDAFYHLFVFCLHRFPLFSRTWLFTILHHPPVS